jgi:hypothetical protein
MTMDSASRICVRAAISFSLIALFSRSNSSSSCSAFARISSSKGSVFEASIAPVAISEEPAQ